MSLEKAVAQAAVRTSVLEAALHSRAPWFIHIGHAHSLAYPTRHEHGVSFRACFSKVDERVQIIDLYEGQELRLSRPFTYPGPGEFCIDWDLSLRERTSA